MPPSFLCILINAVDDTLGRLDFQTLTTQAKMEILIAGLSSTSRQTYCDASGNYKDVCEWKGVECTDGNVTGIQWAESIRNICFDLEEIYLDYLPETIQEFNVENCRYKGTLQMAFLPLHFFSVSCNNLKGSLDLAAMPPQMVHFDVLLNEFSGSVLLNALPESLQHLQIGGNDFHGEIHFEALPQSCEFVSTYKTQLSGNLNFAGMPRALKVLKTRKSRFSGDLCLKGLSTSLTAVFADSCSVNGTLSLQVDATVTYKLKRLDLQNNGLHGSLCFINTPKSLHSLDLEANQFSGTIDWTALPRYFRMLNLRGNTLTGEIHIDFWNANLREDTVWRGDKYTFYLENNQFGGNLSVKNIPIGATVYIDATHNRFARTVVIDVDQNIHENAQFHIE